MCIVLFGFLVFLVFAITVNIEMSIFALNCDILISGSEVRKPTLLVWRPDALAKPSMHVEWPLPPLLPLECSIPVFLASADIINLKCAADGHSQARFGERPGLCLPAPVYCSCRLEKSFSVCLKACRWKWEKQTGLCSNGDLKPAQEASWPAAWAWQHSAP